MQKRRSFFNNEMEQRFSLRKYTIGLCSVCLGFVTIGMGSQSVKADTVNNVEKSSVVRENKMQDTDSANTPDSAVAKPNTTPTETKKNETGSVATTAPKTNSASNDVKINTADSATSAETKPTKANSTVTNSNIVSDQTKSTKAKLVVQSKVRVASKEVKMNSADSATLAEIKPQEIKLAKKVDAKALDEAKVATDNQFNFDDWATEIDNTYLNIIGYSGDRSKQIVVPNGADFAKAGKNDKNLQVEIGKDTLTALIVDGVAPKLSNTDGQKIVAKVDYWSGAFSWKHLHDISGLANLDTSNITDMSYMFWQNQISDLSPLANWNTGNVTDMTVMFYENQISDLSPLANWNTSNVTNMSFMFGRNQISDLSPLANWNTGNVTDMSLMFDNNRISDLNSLANWNTGNVTDMSSMFSSNRISDLSPLANWNTGNVTDMSYMFDNNRISDLNSLANWNTGNVTDMGGMFADNQISDLSPLANWNTSNVTSMGGLFGGMFYNNQISDLSPLANWNTGKVTDMSSMFSSNRISDLSPLANWNTGNVTYMSRMFEGNQISDLSPLANWNTGKVTDMSYMFNDPLNSTINSQSTLNKFHAIAYKLDNTRDLASHSESKTFNDDLQILLDRNVVTNKNSATLIFKAKSSADNTYQIKIYNPNDPIVIQAQALPTAVGTTDTSYQDGYTIITNKFINNGSVKQGISIRNYQDSPFFAQYESTSGLITVVKDKKDLGSINITYQNISGINNRISAPHIGNKPYINHTQNTFYFQPDISPNSVIKSAGLTITVPDNVTIDPDTFIDNVTGKTLKAIKMADNQYQVVLNNTTDGIAVKGLINVPADKLTNGTVHLPGFGMKYTISTYNDKVAPLVATGTSKELSIIPDLASYHGDLININQSKWAFDRNGNQVSNYTSQGFNNRFNDKSIPLEPAVSIQVTNGVETFNMPTGVNITEFRPQFSSNVIDHIDYIFTDGSKQTASSLDKTSKAIRQMKVYFKNGIQSDELADGYSGFNLSFDATYPDGTLIKNFDIFKITGSFSCDELGSTDNVDVAQVMLAPTQELTDGMLAGTIQNESNPAPNANGNSISAMIRNDGLQYQGHLTNPIFYFKYNDLMVPDLSEISASYDNHNKELGPIGLTKIDNNKIHSSIITDSTGQRFIKVKVDGEYYYGSSPYGSSPYGSSSGFYVKIPISNSPDALTATKDWSWYILNNSDEAKTESTIQSNKLSPATVDGNTLSVGGTDTWKISVAQAFTSSTETQGNLNGGPGLASIQDDHRQDPTHFNIYDSIINATNDAKSDLVSVVNLPSIKDGTSQFDVHMTGKASLINVMTGQTYDATITYSYGTGDNEFITGDQVNDWSKVKSIKVVPNGGAPSMTSLRLVVPVEDEHVYDHVGKTIYVSTMTYGEDKTNTNYTIKDGFAVPEKSTILPIIIKPGDRASAKLTVRGQATVHTLIHYKDTNGKDVYVKLPDKDKTYNELQDTMKRSHYLQSDRDLTIADRGLLPTGMVINYDNPTIRNSNNTYVNNEDVFDKMVKYDFDGDQVIFEGAMPEIVTKTHQAKETIHYVYSDGSPAAPDKVLTSITLKQTGSKNPFTGEITWNTPATDALNSVDSPEITGYSADKLTVPSYVVTMTSPDKEVTVTYHANAQTATITYVDDTTKNNLDSKDASGKFGQAITFKTAPTDEIAKYEKQGYKLVSNDFNSNKYQADNSKNVFHVHFVHDTKKVSRNDDVNMTVHYVMDDGSEAPSDSKQTVNFTENGIQDLVTQTITWTPADSQTLNNVTSPVLTGYTADIKTANGKAVNFGDPDINVTVHYNANAQTATIIYIDDTTKNNLDSKDASGKFGQAITFATAPTDEIASYEKQGYKLVSNDFNSNKYQADNSKNVFHVHFVHGTKNVSREHSASFTVHYIYKDGRQAKPDHEQTLSFTENGIQDLITQKITWTPADSQKFDDVVTPVITGYTPDQDKVIGQTANFETGDREVTVTYLPDGQVGHINYIDDNTGKTLTRDDFSGKTNEHEDYTPIDRIQEFENKGYVFVSSDYPDGGFNFDDNDQQDQVFNVHLKHGTTTVTPDNPGHPGEPVDPKNPEGPKYPNGTELDQVKRTGTQTIHYVGAGDKTPADNKQTFIFTREITFDNVTREIISKTPWNVKSHTFGNVDTPVIPGYHTDTAVAGGATVTPDDLNKVIIVTYAPDGGSGDNPGSNGGGDQGTTSAPEPVPEPTPSPDDQPDTTLPSDNNTNKDVEKDKQDKPEEVKKARKIIKTRITKQEHIGNAEKAEPIAEQEHNDQTVASPVKNEDNEHQLPQTGEANTSVIGLLGMLVAGFAAILCFESSRSRKHKN